MNCVPIIGVVPHSNGRNAGLRKQAQVACPEQQAILLDFPVVERFVLEGEYCPLTLRFLFTSPTSHTIHLLVGATLSHVLQSTCGHSFTLTADKPAECRVAMINRHCHYPPPTRSPEARNTDSFVCNGRGARRISVRVETIGPVFKNLNKMS
jgi:hypothetical protein